MSEDFIPEVRCTRCGKAINQLEGGWTWPKWTFGDGGTGDQDNPGPYAQWERLCQKCWTGEATCLRD